LENTDINYWYDANNDNFVNMLEAWIIDPKKVERVALEEAISLAWMFLTTEAWVTDIPKKDDGGCNGACHAWGAWMGWMWGMWMY
jgi:chaperonin GroEL